MKAALIQRSTPARAVCHFFKRKDAESKHIEVFKYLFALDKKLY